MRSAQLVLGPSTANPRSASESLRPRRNRLQGPLPAPAREVDGPLQSGTARVDERVLGWPYVFLVVSAHMSHPGFRATLQEYVVNLVQDTGVGLRFDTKPTETYLELRKVVMRGERDSYMPSALSESVLTTKSLSSFRHLVIFLSEYTMELIYSAISFFCPSSS